MQTPIAQNYTYFAALLNTKLSHRPKSMQVSSQISLAFGMNSSSQCKVRSCFSALDVHLNFLLKFMRLLFLKGYFVKTVLHSHLLRQQKKKEIPLVF